MAGNAKEMVGFIGLGLMGHGMAKNIVEKGYPLAVTAHRNRKPLDDLVGRGAVACGSPREVAERSSIVFLCVTGSREVEAIVRGKDGLKEGLKPGSVVVDCSTSKEAWEGKLDTMVGASDAVFARIKPVLETWAGAKIVHLGAGGDGHKMKLLNNFISLGYAAIYAEALVLGAKVGISPQRFHSVIDGGRMDCGFYQTYMGSVVGGNREAHRFTIANAFKDLTYLEAMADAAALTNPVGNAVKNAFAGAVATGGGGPTDYVPHLPEFVSRANGMDFTAEVAKGKKG